MDIFDRIAAAIAALKNGNDTALQEHVAAIDAHLSQIDQSETDDQTRIANIEAGLQKVADAVAPAPAPAPAGDGSGDAGATTGTGTGAAA